MFDEVQGVPEVITSLKYFQEKAPEFHVIAAGSLLGISLGRDTSFPVGKVNFLTIYPLSFSEYLLARGEELLLDHLKVYLYLGGMPEVVQDYLTNGDIASVRVVQNAQKKINP